MTSALLMIMSGEINEFSIRYSKDGAGLESGALSKYQGSAEQVSAWPSLIRISRQDPDSTQISRVEQVFIGCKTVVSLATLKSMSQSAL